MSECVLLSVNEVSVLGLVPAVFLQVDLLLYVHPLLGCPSRPLPLLSLLGGQGGRVQWEGQDLEWGPGGMGV